MTRLVLWDVDHTLIASGGIGRELMAAAFQRTVGRPMDQSAAVTGRTEQAIFRETLVLHGLARDAVPFEEYARALAEEYMRHSGDLRERGHALPGAAAALAALAERGVTQTLVTGNVRPIAEIKVGAFGLDAHLDFDLGAYGEAAEERDQLVKLAVDRAREGAQPVVIGDTPADVTAARIGGVPVIAVASGQDGADTLAAAGASVVLPSLEDTARVVDLVLGAGCGLRA